MHAAPGLALGWLGLETSQAESLHRSRQRLGPREAPTARGIAAPPLATQGAAGSPGPPFQADWQTQGMLTAAKSAPPSWPALAGLLCGLGASGLSRGRREWASRTPGGADTG